MLSDMPSSDIYQAPSLAIQHGHQQYVNVSSDLVRGCCITWSNDIFRDCSSWCLVLLTQNIAKIANEMQGPVVVDII